LPVSRPKGAKRKLKFCPRCGSLMLPQVRDGKRVLVCPNCGYIEELEEGSYVFESRSQKSPKSKIIVVDATQPPPTAIVLKGSVRCPKCGHDEVLFWMMQTRAADEPPTRFYRCLKCGYSWREYD
jgi:DNA-directed RNA polymerase subunit M